MISRRSFRARGSAKRIRAQNFWANKARKEPTKSSKFVIKKESVRGSDNWHFTISPVEE